MQVGDLINAMETIAPSALAEPWDRVGLLVGDPAGVLTKVLLCIDLTSEVVAEAIAAGCEGVVAYHPPIFKKAEAVVAGTPVYAAVRAGLSVYTPHTALDAAAGGTNDVLADALSLVDRRPLRPGKGGDGTGMGRVGSLDGPVARDALIGRVKRELGLTRLLVAGPTDGEARRVAVCAGSCGDLLDDAVAGGVEFYLTGEMRHHDALKAAAAGMTVVCVLHSNSERVTLRKLRERLTELIPNVDVLLSERDRDPFTVL